VTASRRVAIVTGASSGIGYALAERAARAGYDVFATGRRPERLAQLKESVALAFGRIETLALELRTLGAAERIVRETLAAFGRIDVLVNNAGGVATGPISEQSDAALREQLETHVAVPLALLREALPALRDSGGHVFFVGSGVARIPVGALGAYPPAKAAVRSMARIARNELRAAGIAVTYVDPGAVASEFMTRAGFPGPPPGIAASPAAVALRIFEAFGTRQPIVNAVPWQSAFVALGEALPALTDALLARMPGLVGVEVQPALETIAAPALPIVAPPTAPSGAAAPEDPAAAPEQPAESLPQEPQSEFERALAPLSSRMRRLNLRSAFVAELLVWGHELDTADVALRWAGMPNKNERALTREVLEALAGAGFLERAAEDRYVVVRGAGERPIREESA
jgi:short-subunit dehydrogenase